MFPCSIGKKDKNKTSLASKAQNIANLIFHAVKKLVKHAKEKCKIAKLQPLTQERANIAIHNKYIYPAQLKSTIDRNPAS